MKTKLITALMITLFLASITVIAVPVSAKPRVIKVPEDYLTIQAAVDAANDGDKIIVAAGEWYGAEVTKAVEIIGEEGAIIVDGPAHPSYPYLHFGFKLGYGSDVSGAIISHFTFRGLAFPIFAFNADDVTIEYNIIYDALQGITNWDGNNWVIRHNVIEGIYVSGGGGLGIFIGSLFKDLGASGNLVAHNKIIAEIPDDRTYSAGGIILCADARWGATPGKVSNNKVVHNKVKVTGPDTFAMSLEFLGLSEIPTEDLKDRVCGNLVGFNDFRGSATEIDFVPEKLEEVNTISRNLGNNRAYDGFPASEFKPVE